MRLFMIVAVSALCAGASLGGGSVFAQEAPLAKVYACAGIGGAEARLACFDAAVAGLKQAEAAGSVTVVTPEQAAAAAKESFGFASGSAAARNAQVAAAPASTPPPPEQPDLLTVTVVKAVKGADSRYRFTLENGQVWEQVETETVQGVNALPASAEISKAAMGSFRMKIDGKRAVRVRRVK